VALREKVTLVCVVVLLAGFRISPAVESVDLQGVLSLRNGTKVSLLVPKDGFTCTVTDTNGYKATHVVYSKAPIPSEGMQKLWQSGNPADREGIPHAGVSRDGSFHLGLSTPGKYTLNYKSLVLSEFEIREVKGKLEASGFRSNVVLPFNYAILTQPGTEIKAFDSEGVIKRTIKADSEGLAPVVEENIDSTYAITMDRMVPQVITFPPLLPDDKGNMGRRILSIPMVAFNRKNLPSVHLHNLKTDTYYWLMTTEPPAVKQCSRWWVWYTVKDGRGAVEKLSIPGFPVDTKLKEGPHPLMDEYGNPQVCFTYFPGESKSNSVTKTYGYLGSAWTEVETTYPYFRFRGHYYNYAIWLVPNVSGLPLVPAGNNRLRINTKVNLITHYISATPTTEQREVSGETVFAAKFNGRGGFVFEPEVRGSVQPQEPKNLPMGASSAEQPIPTLGLATNVLQPLQERAMALTSNYQARLAAMSKSGTSPPPTTPTRVEGPVVCGGDGSVNGKGPFPGIIGPP